MARIEDYGVPDGRFLDADDRAALAGCAIELRGLSFQPHAKFGPRWLAEAVVIATGEKVLIGLQDNEARTTKFGAIAAVLGEGGTLDPVVLYLADPIAPAVNQYWSFRSADALEVANPAAPVFSGENDPDGDDVGEVVAAPKLAKARK
jgi:hypothetical protein